MAGILKTVTPYTRGPGNFCVGELDYERANETVVIVANQASFLAGQLLGKITASGKYAVYDPAAADGTENIAGILWADSDTSTADRKAAVTVREATVNAEALQGYAALTTPQKAALITAAKALGIIILTS